MGPPNIQEPAWGLLSASVLWNDRAAGSGWSLSQDEGPPFSSPFPPERRAEPETGVRPGWILLVEDNPADVLLVKEALHQHQIRHTLTLVTNGEEAVDLIQRLDSERTPLPDVVLLDLKLPKKSGFEVLHRMRLSERWSGVQVMILTSSDAREDRQQAAVLGITRYVVKPHQFEEFLKIGGMVKEVLFSQRSE